MEQRGETACHILQLSHRAITYVRIQWHKQRQSAATIKALCGWRKDIHTCIMQEIHTFQPTVLRGSILLYEFPFFICHLSYFLSKSKVHVTLFWTEFAIKMMRKNVVYKTERKELRSEIANKIFGISNNRCTFFKILNKNHLEEKCIDFYLGECNILQKIWIDTRIWTHKNYG